MTWKRADSTIFAFCLLNPVIVQHHALRRAQVAVALGTAVYLWNAGTGVIEELCATTEEDDYITSLAWAADGVLSEICIARLHG